MPTATSKLSTPRLASTEATEPQLDRRVLPSLRSPKLPPVPADDMSSPDVPANPPELSDGSTPLPPPPLHVAASSGEPEVNTAPTIPGNHLTLDPTLSTILFTRGSSNIDPSVTTSLDRLADVLASNGDVRITLIAYAESEGTTPREARRLSLNRALAVRTYLASKGLVDSRIDVRAEGANTTDGYIDRVDVKVND